MPTQHKPGHRLSRYIPPASGWGVAALAGFIPMAAGQPPLLAALGAGGAMLAHWVSILRQRPQDGPSSQTVAMVNKAVLDSVADGIIGLDCHNRITFTNPVAERLSGWTERHLIGQSADQFFPQLPLSHPVDQSLYGVESSLDRRAGEAIPVELHLSPIFERGSVTGRIMVVHDIRERRNAEESRRLAAVVLEWSAQAILVADHCGTIVTVNPAFSRLSGMESDQIIGQSVSILRSRHHDQSFHSALRTTLDRDGVWKGEVWNCRPDGTPYAAWLSITRINTRQDGGFLVAFYFDITERKRHENQIIQAANHDALTGLANRRRYEEILADHLNECRQHGRHLALFMIDLDGFKAVNDTYGHDAGDALLRELSHRMSNAVRTSDFVARLGGDEFVILLPDADQRAATRIAETLLRLLSTPVPYQTHTLQVSASIGIGLLHPTEDPDQLVQAADQAMYAVKKNGKHGYLFAKSGKDSSDPALTETVSDTAPAISEHPMLFSPIISLHSLRTCGVEIVPATLPLPESELADCPAHDECQQSCHMSPYHLDMRRQAVRTLIEWDLLGMSHLTMTIHLTHQELTRCGCVLHLWSMTNTAQLDSKRILLHVPLWTLSSEDPQIQATLGQIRTLGYRLSVNNDPGDKSASPFSLPPDRRPDQVILSLRALRQHGQDPAAVLDGHRQLAAAAGITMLIRDLDHPQDLSLLLSLSDGLAQGPLLSRPIAAADIPRFIATFDPKAWTS